MDIFSPRPLRRTNGRPERPNSFKIPLLNSINPIAGEKALHSCMNRDGETLDISTWRGVKKPLVHRYEAGIGKKSMVNFLSVIFIFPLHLTLHDDGIRPLATFWPIEAIKPSLQAPPLHRTTVLTPRMAFLSRRRWLSEPPTPPTAPTCPHTTMEEKGGCSLIPPFLVHQTTSFFSNCSHPDRTRLSATDDATTTRIGG